MYFGIKKVFTQCLIIMRIHSSLSISLAESLHIKIIGALREGDMVLQETVTV